MAQGTHTLALVKVVDGGPDGVPLPADVFELYAIGPAVISGVSGDPSVTAVEVEPGTYHLSEIADADLHPDFFNYFLSVACEDDGGLSPSVTDPLFNLGYRAATGGSSGTFRRRLWRRHPQHQHRLRPLCLVARRFRPA